ncbi:MAG: DUF47 family protein [Actinobacteria bacterium]|uniref:Unannotated protein n=1 Tax=freshwater metagenome TaxID=449393 RepID=A0A6J5YX25_9ZZZZ|nr:DUF47 family protein [Actinomycetota bacterium]
MGLLTGSGEDSVLALLEESGRNVERSALVLRDLMADYPVHAELARELVVLEHEGDRITHDLIVQLGAQKKTTAVTAEDGYALATALDDIVDYAEQTGDMLGVYGVEAPMEQAVEMCEVLVGASEQVAIALRSLRSGTDINAALVEIHRLENVGDKLHREALAALFSGGIDPMVVIRWKDIFSWLESSIDSCEQVAHQLEGIMLRGRRG